MSDDKPKKKKASKKRYVATRNIFLKDGSKVKKGEIVSLSAAEKKAFEHCLKSE